MNKSLLKLFVLGIGLPLTTVSILLAKTEDRHANGPKKVERHAKAPALAVQKTVTQPAPTTVSLWDLPNKSLRYDQVAYLVAHNAFASNSEGWLVPSQEWNIAQQLRHGVRGFMLSVYDNAGSIALSCGGCTKEYPILKKNIQNAPAKFGPWQPLSEVLVGIQKWLKDNPQEIVTLFFNDNTQILEIDKLIDGIAGLKAMIFTNTYWNFNAHDGYWPTLEQLQKDGKRLIMFTDNLPTPYLLYDSDFMTINLDHTTDIEAASMQKPGNEYPNQNKRLLFLNYFATTPAPLIVQTLKKTGSMKPAFDITANNYSQLKSLINAVKEKLFSGNNRTPNFIALDFVNQGTPFKLINELNDNAEKTLLK